MFGRDPLALTVNNMGATLSMETVAMEVERRGRELTCTARPTRPHTREGRTGDTLHTECFRKEWRDHQH